MPSRHHLTWADLDGRRVGLWGMGMEGRTSLDRLTAGGQPPSVVVNRDPVEGVDALPEDGHGMAALGSCDVVIKTPGISPYAPNARWLAGTDTKIVSGMSLWLEGVDRSSVIAVTGTKGKSTTSAVMAHLLEGLGHTVSLCGNIGRPPFALDAPDDVDRWVVEVSSYQAVDLASGPGVVVATSLNPDHLPWHGTVERYYADKLSLCTLPGVRVVVANGLDPTLREHADLLGEAVSWIDAADDAGWTAGLGMIGRHNIHNARLARAAIAASGISATAAELAAATHGFAPLPSRLTHVTTRAGVDFIDDSLSTNVLPTVAALASFPGRPVALLVGGEDRGIDYDDLVTAVSQRAEPTLVLTLPTTGTRIAALFQQTADLPPATQVMECQDLAEGVSRAWRWGQGKGAVVLLSPAAPSFDHYTDYADRARQFRDHIAALPA